MTQARNIVMVGAFGLAPRMTMRARALPLAKALVARGSSVTVLLPPWQNPEDAGRRWDENGVHVENMALPKGVPGWFHWRLAAHLVRRTRELEPEVVHTFKPKAYAGLAHWALARSFPVVVDADDWEGPGGWNELGGYSPGMQRFFTWQERWGLTRATAVTVASRALQTLAWSMGRPAGSVFYLPNGASFSVPPESLDRPLPGLSGTRPTVLLYTRFFEHALERLWRIMRTVRARRADVRFLIVGKGFTGEEAVLLEMARAEGWHTLMTEGDVPDGDLVYAGWGTGETLSRAFAAADIAIYPFDDTLLNRTKCPVKLMDLLAAGIPVVGDAVGQITEVIVPGETGLLVTPGDEPGFADSILALLASPDQLARMRQAAYEDVRNRYNWDTLAEVAEAAYTFACQHAPGQARNQVRA